MVQQPVLDGELVRRLIDSQFPTWRDLAVEPIPIDGWDNRTFRLGDFLSVRLPSGAGYALQVRKELQWLPVIADGVSLPVPEIVGLGRPGEGYPFEWTVRRWIDGVPVRDVPGLDREVFAADVAAFLLELDAIDTGGGPEAGAHSAGRGGPLSQFDNEVADAIAKLGPRVDAARARSIWQAARAVPHTGSPQWFHGDFAVGNLLTKEGRLSAVIDFGCAGVGDPSCDLVIAWTYLDPSARATFRSAVGVDDEMWSRGKGWALWKALITVGDPTHGEVAAFTLQQLGVPVDGV